MQSIDTYDFKGKRAIIRVDFNVPLNEKLEITDDTRIRAAIPTIKKVLEKGGSVVLMSHLGRPKKGPEAKFSALLRRGGGQAPRTGRRRQRRGESRREEGSEGQPEGVRQEAGFICRLLY